MKVKSILAKKGPTVLTIEPEATLGDLVRQLVEHRIGAMVVTARGRGTIVGIVSERDVVRVCAGHGAAALYLPVAEVMTKEVRLCAPEDDINDIMAVMTNQRLRHLPVLDEGRLVGIVSIGDVVKHRLDELGQEVGMWRELFAQ